MKFKRLLILIFLLNLVIFSNENISYIKEIKGLYNSKQYEKVISKSIKFLLDKKLKKSEKDKENILNLLAESYYNLSQYDKAIKYFNKLLIYKHKDKTKLSYIYNMLGILNKKLGYYKLALDNFKNSLKIAKDINDYLRMSIAEKNIAKLFFYFRFYNKSIEFFKNSINHAKKSEKNQDLSDIYKELANIYNKIKKFDLSFNAYEKALKFSKKFNNRINEALIYKNLAVLEIDLKNYDKAINHLKLSEKISKEIKYNKLLPHIYNLMGEYYYYRGDFKKALNYQRLAESINKEEILSTNIYKDLSRIYLKLKMIKESDKYLKLYLSRENHEQNLKLFNDIEKFISDIEMEKKNYEIELYKKEKKNKTLFLTILILLILFVLFTLLYLFYKHKYTKRINSLLNILSKRDPLTNLSNRRDIVEKLEYERNKLIRNKIPMSFIMADIDDFKIINDFYGDNYGDFILKELAKLFEDKLRRTDIISRWGGEEFLIILIETDSKRAYKVIESIRQEIMLETFIYKNTDLNFTVSFGIYEYTNPDESIESAIEKADKAMHDAKNSGKNKTIIFN